MPYQQTRHDSSGSPSRWYQLLLQEVLFHSSCSEQLFLLDIFGSFQLLEFENQLQGVVGFANAATVDFNLTLEVEGDQLDLDFLSVVLLSPNDINRSILPV